MFGASIDNDLALLATVVGGFATAFAAAFAAVTIPVAYFQIRSNKKTHGMATAKSLYREYLEACFQAPELSRPDINSIKINGSFVQYELFVAHMLYAIEEILMSTNSKEWRNVAKGQLMHHHEYLISDDFLSKKANFYIPEVLDIIRSI